jgi:hypothetical protein
MRALRNYYDVFIPLQGLATELQCTAAARMQRQRKVSGVKFPFFFARNLN